MRPWYTLLMLISHLLDIYHIVLGKSLAQDSDLIKTPTGDTLPPASKLHNH
jgi:hypothetical protein